MRNINEQKKVYKIQSNYIKKTTEFETEITTKNRQENYNLKKVISLNRFKIKIFFGKKT